MVIKKPAIMLNSRIWKQNVEAKYVFEKNNYLFAQVTKNLICFWRFHSWLVLGGLL